MSTALILPHGGDDLLSPTRRRFLGAAAATMTQLVLPGAALAQGFWDKPRELWLRRPAIGDEIRTVYWAQGQIIPEGYNEICRLLRDTHRNLAIQYDVVALDIACGICGWLQGFGMARPLIINSGYRHPLTNASEGGVRNSLHTKGKALDLRIEGVSVESVTRFGLYLSGGGVGFYPSKDFTHVDCGRVRYWRG